MATRSELDNRKRPALMTSGRRTRRQSYSISALPGVEDSVRLNYDVYTPRPHFILVQDYSKSDAASDVLAAAYRIIAGFLREHCQFDQDAILSFHCGRWYQRQTNGWHAHLCVPYQPYLERAKSAVNRSNAFAHADLFSLRYRIFRRPENGQVLEILRKV